MCDVQDKSAIPREGRRTLFAKFSISGTCNSSKNPQKFTDTEFENYFLYEGTQFEKSLLDGKTLQSRGCRFDAGSIPCQNHHLFVFFLQHYGCAHSMRRVEISVSN